MVDQSLPGMIALIGSGETTRYGGQVFEHLIKRYPHSSHVAVLETPAGFELNSPAVAGRVADFLRLRLQNYAPDVRIIPARKRGTVDSPDSREVVRLMAEAVIFFMGPGSPSYALRQLYNSLAWELICARFWKGSSLAIASAAAIALGKFALPVYEIFKVGEDPHWLEGLDLLAPFGLNVVIVPHWNNREGGKELDTSHCFMGSSRFQILREMLPSECSVVGIDELTTLVLDVNGGFCKVMGKGQVHIIRGDNEIVHDQKKDFKLSELGDFCRDAEQPVWSGMVKEILTEAQTKKESSVIPDEITALVEERQMHRDRHEWQAADICREKIESLGWQILDAPEGPRTKRIE